MNESWWERPVCFVCNYWWALLLALVLLLTVFFTRDLWMPTPRLGTGDVQITLSWNSTNDLDLWVTDPAGESIGYSHPTSASNGQLDVDANAGCGNVTTQPVENIYWPTAGAPNGKYVVAVQYYAQCEANAPSPYKVRVLVDGNISWYEGTILAEGNKQEVTTFERNRP